MYRALRTVLLAALVVGATVHQAQAQSNIVIGLPNWPSVLMVPDPAWWSGADGLQDQWCQADRASWYSSWAGGTQNQIAFSCFSVPDPQSGVWNSVSRWRGFTGHTTQTYFSGYEMGVEGQRDPAGSETVDRWYLYRFEDNQTILHISKPYQNSLVLGENNKPIDLYATGMIDVPQGIVRAKGLMLAPETRPTCSAATAGRIAYQAGAPGVKDSVAVCAKASNNVWNWRTIF